MKVFSLIWLLCSLVFVQTPFHSLCQELVPNGGFEKYHELPDHWGQWYKCKNWNELKNESGGSKSYLHLDGSIPDSTHPHIIFFNERKIIIEYGKAMMLLESVRILHSNGAPSQRVHISTRLKSSLLKGQKYLVSLRVANASRYTDTAIYNSTGFGIHFSTSQLDRFQISSFQPPEKTTHVLFPGNLFHDGWKKYSFEFVADSNYNFLTIGHFIPDSVLEFYTDDKIHIIHNTMHAFYFLDDVSVLPGWLYITGDTTICKGEKANLRAFNGSKYRWALDDYPDDMISSDSVITVAPKVTTTYKVYSEEDTAEFTVFVKDVGSVSLGKDTTYCTGERFVLYPYLPGAVFMWPDSSLSDSMVVNEAGTYTVYALKNGCTISDSVRINEMYCDCNISLPNTFTPNGDELNETFGVRFGCSIKIYNLRIYNRWGDKVFETQDRNLDWDGSLNGKLSPEGMYVYKLEYTLGNGDTGNINGKVMLMR